MLRDANEGAAAKRGLLSLITHHSSPITLLLLITFLLFAACERERREVRVDPASSSRVAAGRQTELQPGTLPGRPSASAVAAKDYGENAFAVGEGARLFQWYNCNGCHANGGGGMGPPLMDDKWIYGSEPRQIFETVVAGRPNGMPSFRGKVPDYQVWQLVAYVRSMSRLVPKDVAPGRKDSLSAKEPEAVTEPKPPKKQ
jgi:cytochrome c oxidase cbb3-type subunit III